MDDGHAVLACAQARVPEHRQEGGEYADHSHPVTEMGRVGRHGAVDVI